MGDFGQGPLPELSQLQESLTDHSASSEDINVLVTGFGPFKTNPINPSFIIASSLPSTISLTARNSSKPLRIRVHTHPTAIRVSYSTVRTTVPAIIEEFKREHDGRPPDIIVHVGMASTRHYYSVEMRARRDEYIVTDVDGQSGYEDGEYLWKKAGLPEVLQPGPAVSSDGAPAPPTITETKTTTTTTTTSTVTAESETPELTTVMSKVTLTETTSPLPTKSSLKPRPLDFQLLDSWHGHLPYAIDVRLSNDAGRYLCEFIYYTSLAHALQSGRDGGVVFFHVPGWTDERSIERGKSVAIALIKALAECWADEPKREEE